MSEKLSGVVERITFHSDESGFSVLRVRVPGHAEAVTVTGLVAAVTPGESIDADGEWVNDRRYGMQFKAGELSVVTPATIDGIERYLASGMVRGIGPYFARQLVNAFGAEVFSVIENEPGRLRELQGFGEKRVKMVTESWDEQKAVRDIMVFLQSHGVGTARAVRIYKTYGDRAIQMVTSNPYRLVLDIHGIGFRIADTIALKLGIAQDSLHRVQAGVRHVLQEFAADGHCAVKEPDLLKASGDLLNVDEDTLGKALREEVIHGGVVQEEIDGVPCYFQASFFRAESSVALRLAAVNSGPTPWGELDAGESVQWVEHRTGLQLSASQVEAVKLAISTKLLVITGGPGVGKTTLLNAILQILRKEDVKVALCAPTGRAAKRLSESTGLEAKTIHRLLEFDPHSFDFRHNRQNPIRAGLVVVDEASMIDITLMQKLLLAVPDDAALLIVGDVDQLPSVGPGAVLGDIIASGVVPVITLTEIFRQAAASDIILNAHRINRGEMPQNAEAGTETDFYLVRASGPEDIRAKLMQVVTERIPKKFGYDPVKDIQVLTPMNRGGLGTQALNSALQESLNKSEGPGITRYGTRFAVGDKVIQLANNYDKEVFNGDIGLITDLDEEQGVLEVEFSSVMVSYDFAELDELSLAYATTIHKSQGSEYPAVVIPLSMQHYMLLQRNLLYTAVTRGRDLVMVIAESRAVGTAVHNKAAGGRLTNLAERIRRECQN